MAQRKVITVDISAVEEAINASKISNPNMRSKVQLAIKGEIVSAKMKVSKVAQSQVGSGFEHSNGDPREAWRAIVANIWKSRGLGGSIALQYSGYNTQTKPWNPPRKGTRGKRSKSDRTNMMESYWGYSRGMVLRFLLQGTRGRITGGRNYRRKGGITRIVTDGDGVTPAWRGRIKGKNWFIDAAVSAAEVAGSKISDRVLSLIAENFNNP